MSRSHDSAKAACCNCKPPPFSWGGCGPGGAGAAAGAGGSSAPPLAAAASPGSLSSLSSSSVAGREGALRPLHIPESLTATFLRIASSNTARNIETCGILCGPLRQNELVVDRLLIPSQTGSSDQCSTDDEDAIWTYCESNGVCTLGWIHTHPSQTCFLSSVDLHTHCGYQSMLAEAVAIVLAPKHAPAQGTFRLSHPDPPGLQELQRCTKKGFHPDHQRNGQYAGNGVYENCTHVRWGVGAKLEVIDQRR